MLCKFLIQVSNLLAEIGHNQSINLSHLSTGNQMNPLAHISAFESKLTPLISKLFLPANIVKIATKMPFNANQRMVEKLLNKAFSEQIQDGDFDFLSQRQLQIEVIDAKLFVGLSFSNGKITCSYFSAESFDADATLSINSLDAILLAEQQVDPDTLFFQRKLKIRGDTELAHQVKNTIDTLDPEVIPMFLIKIIGFYKQRVLQRS